MKYPLKLIEWHDAYSGDHKWVALSDLADRAAPLVTYSIGFEIRRDDKHITLAMTVNDEEKVSNLMTIPLAMIVREQTFRYRRTLGEE